MSVMQRKLFANKEARAKLRDMGGIMSSFPELSGEVQRFNNGMMVEAPRPTAAPTFREVDPDATAFTQDVQGLLRQGDIASALSRIQVGLSTGEYGPMGSPLGRAVGYFVDRPEAAARRTAVRTTSQWFNDPENERMLLDNPSLLAEAAVDPIGFAARRQTPEAPSSEPTASRPAPERTGEEPAPAEEEATPTTEQRIADLLPTSPETPDETGGGETDTPDLRARAEERIKLFQDLFGSDEPTARDRAMQFAMIGLAIAAGQSPNALTNIASGLLAGTQAMTAQEAERRKGARELKSDAVDSVLKELEAERKLRLEQREKRQGQQDEIADMWQSVYEAARADAITAGLTTPEAANIYATKAANSWAKTRYPDLFPEGGQEPPFTAPPLSPEERQSIGQQIIDRLRKENRSDAEIARLMRDVDVDPTEFGVTDG